jgi:hypothetical protein
MKSEKDGKTIIVKWWGVLYLKLRHVYLSHVIGMWIPVTKSLPNTNGNDYWTRVFWVKLKNRKGEIVVFPCNYNNGWTNLDTWEDFDNEVTHWKEAKVPKP